MKPIAYIILVILIALLMGTVALSVPKDEPDEPITPDVYYKAGTDIIDKRYTPPNTYEVLYRTTFANGLSVDTWREVSREEYDICK